MNAEGLDVLDQKILDVLKDNARAIFSEIGEAVGLSRVAVKNRIEIMEKLFCYQYNQLDSGKKLKFIRRVMELNS